MKEIDIINGCKKGNRLAQKLFVEEYSKYMFGICRRYIYDQELAKKQEEDAARRNSQVSSGDRSAKIRTYNYSQGRVTDHRIGLTLYDLQNIINGDIQKIVDELSLVENTEKLKEASEIF